MNRKKFTKLFAIMLIAILTLGALSGCGNKTESKKKIKIVATTFPQYDWIREILGDKAKDVNLKLLQKSGGDLHSFQPSADDIKAVADADIFVYVGGESDKWVSDVLKKKTNKNLVAINLMDEMKDSKKAEEVKEGMQPEKEEHDHHDHDGDKDKDHKDGHHHEDAEEVEYDEHVWLSLKNAIKLCKPIEKAIADKDKDNADTYKKNLDAYTEKLKKLDKQYADAVAKAKVKTLVFGDRFPFRYMVDDYGIDYYAAFVGCSAESEASFETIHFLSGKLNQLKLKHVVTIENSDHKIAKSIIRDADSTKRDIKTLDSLQSIKKSDLKDKTYLKTMEQNLEVLKELLSNK